MQSFFEKRIWPLMYKLSFTRLLIIPFFYLEMVQGGKDVGKNLVSTLKSEKPSVSLSPSYSHNIKIPKLLGENPSIFTPNGGVKASSPTISLEPIKTKTKETGSTTDIMSEKPSVSPSPSSVRKKNKHEGSDLSTKLSGFPTVSPSPSTFSAKPRKMPGIRPSMVTPSREKKNALLAASLVPTRATSEATQSSTLKNTSPPTNLNVPLTLLPSHSTLSFVDAYPFTVCLRSLVNTSDATTLSKNLADFYKIYMNDSMPDDSGFSYVFLNVQEKRVMKNGTVLMNINFKPRVYFVASAASPPSKQMISGLLHNSTLDDSNLGLVAYLREQSSGFASVELTPCSSTVSPMIATSEGAVTNKNITSSGTMLWASMLIVALTAGCLVFYTRLKRRSPNFVQKSVSPESPISENAVVQDNISEANNNTKSKASYDLASQGVESDVVIQTQELRAAMETNGSYPNHSAGDICLAEAFSVEVEREKIVKFSDLVVFHTISHCPYSTNLSDVFSDESSLPDFLLNVVNDDDCCFQTFDRICCEGREDAKYVFSTNGHEFKLGDI
jgi:hypothetical protein